MSPLLLWVMYHHTVWESHASLLLWVSIAVLFVSHVTLCESLVVLWFVSHVSHYFCESRITLLFVSHVPPCFCESVSPSCLWVTCCFPNICDLCVILLLWVKCPVSESRVALLLWVAYQPTVCESRASILLWVSIALLFVSHVSSPYYLWVICNTTFVSCVSC
jgi:hypothetical protein